MRDPFETNPLSFGQVAQAICYGNTPDPETVDRLRYLRQLGIPFSESERTGSGFRKNYTFDQLFECALAVEWIRWGGKPRHVAEAILRNRADVGDVGRKVLKGLKDEDLKRALSLKGGLHQPTGDEILAILSREAKNSIYGLDLVKRSAKTPGAGTEGLEFARRLPVFGRATYEPVVPLFQLVASLVAHARNAPETRPGPR